MEPLLCPKHCSGDTVGIETEESPFPRRTYLLEDEIQELFRGM